MNEPVQKRNQREVVLEELAKFLRQRTEPTRTRWPSLDRPIVLTLITTLIGGGIVGGATTWWQVLEKRRSSETEYQRTLVNTKFAVFQAFTAAYQSAGNVLNSWLVHVLWIAEERNKPASRRDAQKIKGWTSEITRLQGEYAKTASVDGVLAQVDGAYSSGEVRTTAQAMAKKMESLENLMRDVNNKYNVAESLSQEEIAQFDSLRRTTVHEIETLKGKLLTQMGEEIRGTGR